MMRKSTAKVTLGAVMAAGVSFACASEPDREFTDTPADWQQICVQYTDQGQNMLRGEDHQCKDSSESDHGASFRCIWCWYYLGKAFGPPPAVGQKIPTASASGSHSRPATGTVAKPPASGGFGLAEVAVGS